MDTDDFPSFDDTYDWLLLTVLGFDDFANLRDVLRRNVASSLSEKIPWDIYLKAKKEIKFAFIEELNYIFLYSESLS